MDKKERLNMLSRVEKEIARVSKNPSPSQLSALQALKYDLEVKTELNDPEVQKNFKHGKSKDWKRTVDMGKPVYRYMRQKQFEKAPKSKLLERITQMKVVPDLLSPGFNPTVEVAVHLPEGQLEPGVFIKPEQSIERPQIDIINFHPETKLYTVLMVDPDSPDVINKTYQQHCHWLSTNIPLSTTSPTIQGGNSVLDYVPPHPQKGTPYHRYTIVVMEQPNDGQEKIDVQVESRDKFDLKDFIQSHNLKPLGATFFREKWDENVSKIYSDILKQDEPIYGKPPKEQRYIQRTTYY
ncbi:phosphatidylethanolamine-binding protein [Pilobolus umbonatus]|nr:phosphatidylethanolamine-binding protein [Pilobolus umbonatus]